MRKHILVLVLMVLPMLANAVEVNGINYQLYNGATPTAAVIKKSPVYSGNVVIPKSFVYNGTTYIVTEIDNWAFSSCKNLTSISIPATVNEIGSCVVSYSGGLSSIVVDADNLVYDSRDNCNAIIETKTNILIAGCNNTIIPSTVTAIGDHAFQDMDGITSLEIPNSVTSIGMQAFNMCDGITTLAIPNSVTTIDYLAFSWMSNLKSIVIGTGITKFEDAAFQDCHALTSLTLLSQLPPTVSDGEDPFLVYPSSSMKGQITLYVPKGSKSAYQADAYWSTFAGIEEVSPDVEVDGIRYELNGKNATVISREDGYKGSIVIPESFRYQGMDYDVIGIGERAFELCQDLTSVSIPNSVVTISNYAFNYCSGLTSITIPDEVLLIGQYAFMLCQGLTSVSIGKKVNTIGEGAFEYCEALTSVVIPNSVVSIEQNAFCYCSNLASVTLPNELGMISSYTFRSCEKLSDINIPSSVTYIDDNAFLNCSGLKKIVLPEGITHVGKNAFQECTGLTSVTSLSTTPPEADEDAFSNYTIPLYVPAEALTAYQNASPWKKFTPIEQIRQKCETPVITVKDGQVTFTCETEGVEFKSSISKDFSGEEVNPDGAYTISVYATKDGYEDSDIATTQVDLACKFERGDVNGDGNVSITDAVSVVNIILNNGGE